MGVVIVPMIRTGLGSALFHNGVLIPNFEIGWMEIEVRHTGSDFTASAREAYQLSWSEWGQRICKYFQILELIFRPSLFILGGDYIVHFEQFALCLNVNSEVKPAHFNNDTGIIGAALSSHLRIEV